MALRQRGKGGIYYAYFRTVASLPDGRLKYTNTTVSLGTSDLLTARAMEAEIMRKNKAARLHQKFKAKMIALEIASGERSESDAVPIPVKFPRRKRLKLADALTVAGRYKKLGDTAKKRFLAFVSAVPYRYMDEISPEIAFEYLSTRYPDCSFGKTYNNTKSALNGVFKLTLLDSGLPESPFEKIPNRVNNSLHQRPFTEAEFVKIYNSAVEPWRTASLIAYFTGLRQKDVFSLQWSAILDDVITTTPCKTARFGRSVQVPLHAQVKAALSLLPRVNDRVLGAWPYLPKNSIFKRVFSELLKRLGIDDNDRGIVNFNSFRDSFITRCDAAGIPRHAIRGVVGHVSDEQTDLYSHDLESAKMITKLNVVKLD